MYGGDLKNVMYDIYVLAHHYGMSPIYIESISPADRSVYMFFVNKEIKELEEQQKQEERSLQSQIQI